MVFLGDVHGKFDKMLDGIERYDIRNETIIQVGDFGVGFLRDKEQMELYLSSLGEILSDRRITMYVVRGNHDDPNYFNELKIYGRGLILVPDYTYLGIDGQVVLCIGGGVSIDKSARHLGVNYFGDDELMIERPLISHKFDILVTHVPDPNIFYDCPKDGLNYWINADPSLKLLLEAEHNILMKLGNKVECKYWVAGHYHMDRRVRMPYRCYDIVGELKYLEILRSDYE